LLLGILGGERGAYTLLVQLPIIPEPSPGSSAGYVWPGTNIPFNPGEAGFIGPAAYKVFMVIRDISLMFFALVLIVAAICYVTESFRVMREGTALSIITGSVFALIMIFMALPLYNAVAALFNELTKPGGPILGEGMIAEVISKAIYSGGGFGLEVVVQFFGSVLFLALTTIVLVVAGVLGVMRLFMIGALTATLPLWIILHAMPPTRRVGESMIEHLIGLVLASLISAIILRFGYEVTSTGFQGLMATVAALATLIVAALMPTVLAPRLGGMMMTGAMMATAAAATATQATVGATLGGATALGGVLSARQAAKAAGIEGPGTAAMAQAVARGMLRGFTVGASTRPMSIGGFTGIPSPGAIMGSMKEGAAIGKTVGFEAVLNRAGSSLEGLIYKWGSTPMPGESASAGLSWYNEIKDNPEAIGREFAAVFPENIRGEMFRDREDYATLGAEIKPLLDQAARNKPEILHRLKGGLDQIRHADDEKKKTILSEALDRSSENRAKFERVLGSPARLSLERFDKAQDYYRRVFTEGGIPEYYGKTVGGVTYHLMLEGYDHDKLDPDAGRMLFEQWLGVPEGKRLSDEEAGKWVSENITPIPKEHWKDVGHAFKQMMHETCMRNPRLLTNFFNNLERVKAYGGIPSPAAARQSFDSLAQNVQSLADARGRITPQSLETAGDFFKKAEGGGGGGAATPTQPSQEAPPPQPIQQPPPPPQQQTPTPPQQTSSPPPQTQQQTQQQTPPPPQTQQSLPSGEGEERGQLVTQRTEVQPAEPEGDNQVKTQRSKMVDELLNAPPKEEILRKRQEKKRGGKNKQNKKVRLSPEDIASFESDLEKKGET